MMMSSHRLCHCSKEWLAFNKKCCNSKGWTSLLQRKAIDTHYRFPFICKKATFYTECCGFRLLLNAVLLCTLESMRPYLYHVKTKYSFQFIELLSSFYSFYLTSCPFIHSLLTSASLYRILKPSKVWNGREYFYQA